MVLNRRFFFVETKDLSILQPQSKKRFKMVKSDIEKAYNRLSEINKLRQHINGKIEDLQRRNLDLYEIELKTIETIERLEAGYLKQKPS